MSTEPTLCTGCHKPQPREWCWNGKPPTGCPSGKPPRWELHTPNRVLIDERTGPLGQRTLTTRYGDIADGRTPTPGQYATPPPTVILIPERFYQAAAQARTTDKVVITEGCENELNDESNVLTISADNGVFAYDLHPAYWPLGPGDMAWYIGVLR